MSMNGELSWPKKASVALDVVKGLHFLHSHGVSRFLQDCAV